MKQKLGLAQALVGQPDLLVLDEPTNGLDPRGIADFYQILHERVKAGATVLLSSHLLAELDGHISHIALLRQGRIIASGSCESLMHQAGLPCRVSLRPVLLNLAESAVARLEGTLSEQGWSLNQTADTWEMILPNDQLQDLLQWLGTMECKFKDIQIHQPTLNDLYLRAFVPSSNDHPKTPPEGTDQYGTNRLQVLANGHSHSANNHGGHP
jgi:Cu-processing system ATP-binding protein